MNDCIFCKIIVGEVPSQKVYEDDLVVAFLDIAPINAGHTLLIPKEHHANLLDCPEEVLRSLIVVLQKLGRAVSEAVGADGFNVGLNNGRAAGQIVDHTHFHIIPRFTNDGLKSWSQRKYEIGEDAATAEKIRQAIKV